MVKSLKEYGLLIKDVCGTIEDKAKIQKGWFLRMFLGKLGSSLLENLLPGKIAIRAREGTIRERHDF